MKSKTKAWAVSSSLLAYGALQSCMPKSCHIASGRGEMAHLPAGALRSNFQRLLNGKAMGFRKPLSKVNYR